MGTCDPNCSCNVTCSRVCTSVGGCSGYLGTVSSPNLTLTVYNTIKGWINTFRANFGYQAYAGAPSGAVTAASWNTHVRDAAQLAYYKWTGSSLDTVAPSISTAVQGQPITNNPPNEVSAVLNNHRCYTVYTSQVCVSVCSCVGYCSCEDICGCVGYCACDSECGCVEYCPDCPSDYCSCEGYCVCEGYGCPGDPI